jgi:hypothetical protein
VPADLDLGGLRLAGIAGGADDGRPLAGELARGDQPEAAVGAGDDGRAPALVWNLVGGPGDGPGS